MMKTDSIGITLSVTCAERQNLSAYLEQIWQLYFSDIPRVNEVLIKYCYPWKSRLGLIRLSLDQCVSFIGVNTLLQSPLIPNDVLLVTIAHELTHYAHGFGSPLPRACLHPHANRVVDRELESRDLGVQLRYCNEWIDKYWHSFYSRQREATWPTLYGANYLVPYPQDGPPHAEIK